MNSSSLLLAGIDSQSPL